MADIQPPQERKGIFEKNRWLLFVISSFAMLFVTLWLMFMHVGQDGLMFIHVDGKGFLYDKFSRGVPDLWVHRAIVYNSFDEENLNYTLQLETPPSNSLKATNRKLVCYYNFPPTLVDVFKKAPPVVVEPDLCTHINLAFGTVVNSSVFLTDVQLAVASNVIGLKANDSSLKILLSVGGAGNGNGYPEMVAKHENRKLFIRSVLDLIKKHKFDGIDLDWEFPAETDDTDKKQRMHFTQLLSEIRNEINRQDKHKFLLTVAVATPVFIVDNSYDVSYMNDYVDYVNLMSYDYHFYTKLTPFTGINAPLYQAESDGGYFQTMNINYSVHYWMSKGMAREKIVIGLPTYGHSFRLINPVNNGIRAPANGYGNLGSSGFAGYNEICMYLTKNRIIPAFDNATKSPYATRNHEWISYDNLQSLAIKAEYIKNNNFGGAMIYALNSDDYQGVCTKDGVTFPLTRKVKEVLESV